MQLKVAENKISLKRYTCIQFVLNWFLECCQPVVMRKTVVSRGKFELQMTVQRSDWIVDYCSFGGHSTVYEAVSFEVWESSIIFGGEEQRENE